MRFSVTFALAALVLCLMAAGAAADHQSSSSQCKRGRNGCHYCASKWKCGKCKHGYWLYKGKCQRCPSWCSKCKSKWGKAYCTSCKHPYTLYKGKCIKKHHDDTHHNCPHTPTWDGQMWVNVYGKTSSGHCKKCTPTGYHWQWCKACHGNNPSWCTKCEDPNNNHPMYVDAYGACQFCSQKHDGCLACENTTGKCMTCDTAKGYWSDGYGGCTYHHNHN